MYACQAEDNFDGMSDTDALSPLFLSLSPFIRSDSYFDYIVCVGVAFAFAPFPSQTQCSLCHSLPNVYKVFVCVCVFVPISQCDTRLQCTLHIFGTSSRKCHRLRECIIVETVKSLTGRDTIYIYGVFVFAMLHLILMHTHRGRWECGRREIEKKWARFRTLWQVNE